MLGNLFRRSTDHKQRVNKKRNVEIDSPASSGDQGKYFLFNLDFVIIGDAVLFCK